MMYQIRDCQVDCKEIHENSKRKITGDCRQQETSALGLKKGQDEHTSGSVQGTSKETKWVIQGVELENSGEKFGVVDSIRRYYESNGEP